MNPRKVWVSAQPSKVYVEADFIIRLFRQCKGLLKHFQQLNGTYPLDYRHRGSDSLFVLKIPDYQDIDESQRVFGDTAHYRLLSHTNQKGVSP